MREPVSKLNPDVPVEIRKTEHLFFRLDLLQPELEAHAADRKSTWKPNVRSMTKNWLNMGLRPRAITRDIEWGVRIPLDDQIWATPAFTQGSIIIRGLEHIYAIEGNAEQPVVID